MVEINVAYAKSEMAFHYALYKGKPGDALEPLYNGDCDLASLYPHAGKSGNLVYLPAVANLSFGLNSRLESAEKAWSESSTPENVAELAAEYRPLLEALSSASTPLFVHPDTLFFFDDRNYERGRVMESTGHLTYALLKMYGQQEGLRFATDLGLTAALAREAADSTGARWKDSISMVAEQLTDAGRKESASEVASGLLARTTNVSKPRL